MRGEEFVVAESVAWLVVGSGGDLRAPPLTRIPNRVRLPIDTHTVLLKYAAGARAAALVIPRARRDLAAAAVGIVVMNALRLSHATLALATLAVRASLLMLVL